MEFTAEELKHPEVQKYLQSKQLEALGHKCRCCGHSNFKNDANALCDYCFLSKINDSSHQCKKVQSCRPAIKG